jgi:hypothetical protein
VVPGQASHLPDALAGKQYFTAGSQGWEAEQARRIARARGGEET